MEEEKKHIGEIIEDCIEALKPDEINEEAFRSVVVSESPEIRECRLRSMAYSLNEIYASMRKLTFTMKSVGKSLAGGMIIAALYLLSWIYILGLYKDTFSNTCFMYVVLIGASTVLYWHSKGPRSSTHFKGTYTVALFSICFKIAAFLFAPVVLLGVAWFPGVLLHGAVNWIPEEIFMMIIFFLPFIQLGIILICGICWLLKRRKLNHYMSECQASLDAQEYAEFSLYFDQICNSAVYA